ncbi:hypothetical protein O1611_g1067 [Lasiodiplodia mahajangana]|uniref:Uncharacterized protein n=1 Tax=Lasiodiplodia mahajangana TaxID=1108764 RepID=A0ACC2JYG3_9PEZI|nr:hypothetical protein O1611_g1067 [Lasiodiplodia mahajangana]
MTQAAALHAGMRRIEGLYFDSEFRSPLEIYKAFISHTGPILEDQIPAKLAASLAAFYETCIQLLDVWKNDTRRVAFAYAMQVCWDSPHLLHTMDIRDVLIRAHGARRMYKKLYPEAGNPVDNTASYISYLMDSMEEYIEPRLLAGPAEMDKMFPHAFGSLDFAVLGEPRVREMVFPNREPDSTIDDDINNYYAALVKDKYTINPFLQKSVYKLDQYPTKQINPLATRAYLTRLALAAGAGHKRYPLFLAPVAFITHKQRQDWYGITTRASRYYATVEDLLIYFHDFASGTRNTFQDRLLALATPWLFDIKTVVAIAKKDKKAVSDVWAKKCFQTGLVFVLSRLNIAENPTSLNYRLLVLQPPHPRGPLTREASDMVGAQDAWVADAIEEFKSRLNPKEIWIGSMPEQGGNGASGKEESPVDPVVASTKLLESAMTFTMKIPDKHYELHSMQFKPLDGQHFEFEGNEQLLCCSL